MKELETLKQDIEALLSESFEISDAEAVQIDVGVPAMISETCLTLQPARHKLAMALAVMHLWGYVDSKGTAQVEE